VNGDVDVELSKSKLSPAAWQIRRCCQIVLALAKRGAAQRFSGLKTSPGLKLICDNIIVLRRNIAWAIFQNEDSCNHIGIALSYPTPPTDLYT
jgi:hypothetical protein